MTDLMTFFPHLLHSLTEAIKDSFLASLFSRRLINKTDAKTKMLFSAKIWSQTDITEKHSQKNLYLFFMLENPVKTIILSVFLDQEMFSPGPVWSKLVLVLSYKPMVFQFLFIV